LFGQKKSCEIIQEKIRRKDGVYENGKGETIPNK
jgi:hypothetical protein